MVVRNIRDLYWKNDDYRDEDKPELFARVKSLGDTRLKNRNLKGEHIAALRRHSRQIVCYDRCSDEEIQAFAKVRGVRPSFYSHSRNERGRIIDGLERADEDLHFSRFLDLPPELRVKVYDHYVAAFPHPLTQPMRPPLARTCHLMRQEVPPVFFADCTFNIDLRHNGAALFREDKWTRYWLLHLRPVEIGWIRKLRLVLRVRDDGYGPGGRFYCNIKLNRTGPEFEITLDGIDDTSQSVIHQIC